MKKNPDMLLNEVIFGTSDKKISAYISRMHKQRMIRRIAPRLYTSNHTDPVEDIVRRNLFIILGSLYPGALISHRTAFEFMPTPKGHIFLTYKYTRKVKLPGITIRFLEGPGPISGDNPFSGGLFVAQPARALLENMQLSKRSGEISKVLDNRSIEDRLEQIARISGEDELNRLRDKARVIAEILDMNREFQLLNIKIGAILQTHDARILTSPLAAARAFGYPYDPRRIELFEELFRALHNKVFESRPDKNVSSHSFRNFAFFESYFSNYIEGTVFAIEEARQIIETRTPIPARSEDSHDVLGTYKIVSDKTEISKTPSTPDEFLDLLQNRHKTLMHARVGKNPGLFKDQNNYAGMTAFVDFNLVRGTLIRSFDLYKALNQPFARAAYMMFVVSEVHPFLDGNGRMARIMMNAELVSGGQSKIIIPTVLREDYLSVLRKLSRQNQTASYIRFLQRVFAFSACIFGDDIRTMEQYLSDSNAFMEQSEGKLHIISDYGPTD